MSARFAALMHELAPATFAATATNAVERTTLVAESRESQPYEDRTAKVLEIRHRLLLNGRNLGIDESVLAAISIHEIESLEGYGSRFIGSYLYALRDSALRARGKVPGDETAPAICRKCGPIWLASEVAAVALSVDGWPRVLGCPWCHVKDRGLIPRPAVVCADCEHFAPDSIHPSGGVGGCGKGIVGSPHYPHAKRQCAVFLPKGSS